MKHGHRARRRFLELAFALLVVCALGAPAAGAAPPHITGAWTPTTGGPAWHFTQSGSGQQNLRATWAGSGTHASLRGSFTGTLSGTDYAGNFVVDEGPTHVTGTMSVHPVNSTTLTVTITATGGSPQTITFHGHAAGSSSTLQPTKIDISFHDGSGSTIPFGGGGLGVPSSTKCPGVRTAATVSGHIEAQITEDGRYTGSGVVDATPHDTKCHTPSIKFAVDRISVEVVDPGHIIHATLYVHIDQEARQAKGNCVVNTPGTVEATYDDTKTAANGLNEDDLLKIGPWGGTGCSAHLHTMSDDDTGTAFGGTMVRANIACEPPPSEPPGGYSPRNCGA